ncbi:hypothetical protein FACS189434_12760 [Bacteroidia bacterium]|nr:hypothetical protein FACS189434_12760 [Bacteroidia bacterium]
MRKNILRTWIILALSFFGTASANTDVTLGTYADEGGFVAKHYLKDVNPNEPFNFAIKVDDDAMKMLLDAAEGRTLVLTAFRYADTAEVVTNFANHEIRLIPKGNYVYVAENYDATGENPLEDNLSGHIHTGFFVAGDDFWWNQNIMSGINPADNYLYIGTFKVPAGLPDKSDGN